MIAFSVQFPTPTPPGDSLLLLLIAGHLLADFAFQTRRMVRRKKRLSGLIPHVLVVTVVHLVVLLPFAAPAVLGVVAAIGLLHGIIDFIKARWPWATICCGARQVTRAATSRGYAPQNAPAGEEVCRHTSPLGKPARATGRTGRRMDRTGGNRSDRSDSRTGRTRAGELSDRAGTGHGHPCSRGVLRSAAIDLCPTVNPMRSAA